MLQTVKDWLPEDWTSSAVILALAVAILGGYLRDALSFAAGGVSKSWKKASLADKEYFLAESKEALEDPERLALLIHQTVYSKLRKDILWGEMLTLLVFLHIVEDNFLKDCAIILILITACRSLWNTFQFKKAWKTVGALTLEKKRERRIFFL